MSTSSGIRFNSPENAAACSGVYPRWSGAKRFSAVSSSLRIRCSFPVLAVICRLTFIWEFLRSIPSLIYVFWLEHFDFGCIL